MAKKTVESTIVTGETKSGVRYSIDSRIKDDARLLYLLTRIQSDEVKENPTEASDIIFKVFRLMFGNDDNLMAFMNAVAEANNGVCSVDVLTKEVLEMFDGLNLKNSSSSPG